MARLPPPMTMITSSIPDSMASSPPYSMVGLSTRGSISLGCALVTGRKRVPSPAAVMIALRTGIRLIDTMYGVPRPGQPAAGQADEGGASLGRYSPRSSPTRARQASPLQTAVIPDEGEASLAPTGGF